MRLQDLLDDLAESDAFMKRVALGTGFRRVSDSPITTVARRVAALYDVYLEADEEKGVVPSSLYEQVLLVGPGNTFSHAALVRYLFGED